MSVHSRRKLLKSIAAGSGAIVAGKSLPESWSRPVVDYVMLPAHAETSPIAPAVPTIYSSTNIPQTASLDRRSDSMVAGLMNGLVSEARAQSPSIPNRGCAMIVGENADFWMQDFDGEFVEGEFNGILPLSGLEVTANWIDACNSEDNGTFCGSVIERNNDYIDIKMGDDGTYRFPVAPSCVSRTDLAC